MGCKQSTAATVAPYDATPKTAREAFSDMNGSAALSDGGRSPASTAIGNLRVHTPVPRSLHDFHEFGEANVLKCISYLKEIATMGEAAATADVPAHRLCEPYVIHTITHMHHHDAQDEELQELHINHAVPDVKQEIDVVFREYTAIMARRESGQKQPARARGITVSTLDEAKTPDVTSTPHKQMDLMSEEAIIVRAHCLCEAHRDTLRVAHINFDRALDQALITELLGTHMLSKKHLQLLCAAFALANTSHSGHLTVRQLVRFVSARRGSTIRSIDGPSNARNPDNLQDSVVFNQILRVIPPPHDDGFMPEEFIALAVRLCTMSEQQLSDTVFECLSSRIYRLRESKTNLAAAAAAAARDTGNVAFTKDERAIRVNSIRERFPILREANSNRANEALLEGFSRVYHDRLGTFSEDELNADGVLCDGDDWEQIVAQDVEVMRPVVQLRHALYNSTLGDSWKKVKHDREAVSEDGPAIRVYPAKLTRHHSEVIELVPMSAAAPHRRVSDLAVKFDARETDAPAHVKSPFDIKRRRTGTAIGNRPRRSSHLAPNRMDAVGYHQMRAVASDHALGPSLAANAQISPSARLRAQQPRKFVKRPSFLQRPSHTAVNVDDSALL